MKKRMPKLLTSIFSVLLVATVAVGFIPTANAEENSPEIHTEGLWDYYVQDGEAVTVRFDDKAASGDVEVPATLGGYPVTTVGNNTFEGSSFVGSWNEDINSITISNNVTTVEVQAFIMCSRIKCVIIGDNVKNIRGCFDACFIDNVYLGSSITELSMFSYCGIKNIEISPNNKNFSSDDGVVFNKDKTKLILYPGANARTSYTIPENVTIIGTAAFSGIDTGMNLEQVIFHDNVTTIERNAFYDYAPQIYYEGSEEQWNNISIDSENYELLNNATINYNYVISSSDTEENSHTFIDTLKNIIQAIIDFFIFIYNAIASIFI